MKMYMFRYVDSYHAYTYIEIELISYAWQLELAQAKKSVDPSMVTPDKAVTTPTLVRL
jgi:hypothetical protein